MAASCLVCELGKLCLLITPHPMAKNVTTPMVHTFPMESRRWNDFPCGLVKLERFEVISARIGWLGKASKYTESLCTKCKATTTHAKYLFHQRTQAIILHGKPFTFGT